MTTTTIFEQAHSLAQQVTLSSPAQSAGATRLDMSAARRGLIDARAACAEAIAKQEPDPVGMQA